MLIETPGCSGHQDGARKLLGIMAVLARLLAQNVWRFARKETLSGKFSAKHLGSWCSSACLWEHSGLSLADTWVSTRTWPSFNELRTFRFADQTATLSLFCCLYTFLLWSPNAAKWLYRPFVDQELCFSFSRKHSGREPDPLFGSSFEQQQATLSHVAGKEIVELGKILTVQPHQLHQRPKTPNFYPFRRR